jgi:regulatory protein
MMITALVPDPRRKSRLRVYLNGVVAGEVSRKEARARSLRPGKEFSREQLDAIVAEDERRRAIDGAVALLARRPRSEQEVRRRLRQRRIASEVVEATIARLRDARLLDDAEFARAYADARSRTSPRSRRMLVQELRATGVDLAVAQDAVEEQSDVETAYQLAKSRCRSLLGFDDQRFAARLSGLLQRRGYGWGVSRSTIERCRAEGLVSGDADASVG